MKIVVIGNGYVGSYMKSQDYTVYDRNQFNYEYPNPTNYKPLDPFDVIINAAGYTSTRDCECNMESALIANAMLPKDLSNYCQQNNKQFVHISTGCLYDREDSPCKENEFIVAHCNYTITKFIGEKFCHHNDIILRPRLLFDERNLHNNVLVRLSNYKTYIPNLNSLTYVGMISEVIESLLKKKITGIFNVACDNYISPYEIAKDILFPNGLIKQEPILFSSEQMRNQEHLYLVNNCMDLSNLKRYYNPPNIVDKLNECVKELRKYYE